VSTRPSFVVTGAAQGVGRAIAERLAQSGRVVVLDVARQLTWQHANVDLISGDAGDPPSPAMPHKSLSRPGRWRDG